jgi:hypothetical protein
MKTQLLFFILFLSLGVNKTLTAQNPTTAYDFNMDDCNGKMHHLFSELDSGNVVVMEFFMLSCSPCIVAGKSLDAMITPLKKKYGTKVRFYQFGFTKSYTCTQIQSWVSTNGFANSVPFDSGDVQVAYYGGMGMPTVAVVGGKGHDVLFTSMDFKPNTDSATISTAIHTFFNTTGIQTNEDITSAVSVYPNPTSGLITLNLKLEKQGTLNLTLTNLQGQNVLNLSNENLKPGNWNKTIALPRLKNGVYFLNGSLGEQIFTKKITIVND